MVKTIGRATPYEGVGKKSNCGIGQYSKSTSDPSGKGTGPTNKVTGKAFDSDATGVVDREMTK